MTIDFTKGNFAVYESKTEKGQEEVETLKYFNDYQDARKHMAKRLIEVTQETETICGYDPKDTRYYEAERDSIKDCGSIIKEVNTGKNIWILYLFINPAIEFNYYEQ